MNGSTKARSALRREAGKILKRKYHLSCRICLWGKFGQQNQIIIVRPSFSKSFVFKIFASTRKQNPCVYKFLEESFWKAPFFHYGLLYTVGLTVELEIKLRLQISPLLFGRCLIFFQYDNWEANERYNLNYSSWNHVDDKWSWMIHQFDVGGKLETCIS